MKSKLNVEHSLLHIYNPLIDGYFAPPADITPWIEKKRVYFISSAKYKNFIAVGHYNKTTSVGANPVFKIRCLLSQKYHDEKNYWMLFRLLPTSDFLKQK